MGQKSVTILCSGFGLGFYVIGLLLEQRFIEKDVPVDVLVFESLMSEKKKEQIIKSKKVYHKKFSVALMSTRMIMDIRESIDANIVEDLLNRWEREGRSNFIVLSGHWMHIIELYRKKVSPKAVHADIIYTDSEPSPSWKSLKALKPDYSAGCEEIYLFDSARKSIDYQIPVTNLPVVPFNVRPNRFVIHGGGWGMGTYQSKITELEEKGIRLDVIGYEPQETAAQKDGNRYFANNPDWSAWNRNAEGRYEFPPLGLVNKLGVPEFSNNDKYHPIFDLIRNSKAIISKTGGGTFVDSLGAATPVIMLEPFGDHEKVNAELWEYFGFGIMYEKWKETGFSMEILEDLHNKLLAKKEHCADYSAYYISKYKL